MNDDEAREDARHHETIDHEDARHVKILELEHRRITCTKETSRRYTRALKSIGDGLCSINQYFQH